MSYALPPYGQVGDVQYRPTASQFRFHASTSNHKLFLGGVGSGKTHAGAREMVNRALVNGPNCLYWIGAPSHTIIAEGTWPRTCSYLDALAKANGFAFDVHRWTSPQNRRIKLINGSELAFHVLDDPDRLAAADISGFWIDEAALLKDGNRAWNVCMERRRQNTGHHRFGLATTTPRGAVGIVQYFLDRRAAGDPDFFMVRGNSADNKANPPEYVENMRKGMSDREIAQQINAEILSATGAVYSGTYDQAQSVDWTWTWPRGGRRENCDYYLCFDWGPNYPHVLWVEYNRDTDTDTVFDEFCEDEVHHSQLLELSVAQGRARWGLAEADYTAVYCDDNPYDARIEAYRRFRRGRGKHDRPVISERKKPGEWEDEIELVAWRLKDHEGRRRLKFASRLTETRSRRRILLCMLNYKWIDTSAAGSRVLTDRVEKGVYDHGPDALRYCLAPRHRAAKWRRAAA